MYKDYQKKKNIYKITFKNKKNLSTFWVIKNILFPYNKNIIL